MDINYQVAQREFSLGYNEYCVGHNGIHFVAFCSSEVAFLNNLMLWHDFCKKYYVKTLQIGAIYHLSSRTILRKCSDFTVKCREYILYKCETRLPLRIVKKRIFTRSN